MKSDLAVVRLPRVPQLAFASGVERPRLATGALCAAFVAAGMAVNSVRLLESHQSFVSLAGFFTEQVGVLGLLAAILAVVTLAVGLFYWRGLAARVRIARGGARAVHVTLAMSTVATIVLQVFANRCREPVHRLSGEPTGAVRVVGSGGFRYPLAAGIVALWLIVLFGLAYFVGGRLGGHPRWRVLHRVMVVAVAVSLLHTVLLAG